MRPRSSNEPGLPYKGKPLHEVEAAVNHLVLVHTVEEQEGEGRQEREALATSPPKPYHSRDVEARP